MSEEARSALVGLVPLALVLAAAIKRERPATVVADSLPHPPWGFALVIAIIATLTVITFPWAAMQTQPDPRMFSVVLYAQAFVLLAIVYAILRSRYAVGLSALGLRRQHALYQICWSLRVGCFVLLGGEMLMWLLIGGIGGGRPVASRLLDRARGATVGSPASLGFWNVILMFGVVVLAPFAEEVLFRGIVFGPARQKFGSGGAVVFSTALWASAHLYDPGRAITASVVGLIYGSLYAATGSLWPSLTLHVLQNAGIVAALSLLSVQMPQRLLLAGTIATLACLVVSGGLAHKMRPGSRADRLGLDRLVPTEGG